MLQSNATKYIGLRDINGVQCHGWERSVPDDSDVITFSWWVREAGYPNLVDLFWERLKAATDGPDLYSGNVESLEVDEKLVPSVSSESLLKALDGEYILPGPGGDPIRNPGVLPSGKGSVMPVGDFKYMSDRELADIAAYAPGSSSPFGHGVFVYPSVGGGNFGPPQFIPLEGGVLRLDAADLNSDGYSDLVVINQRT